MFQPHFPLRGTVLPPADSRTTGRHCTRGIPACLQVWSVQQACARVVPDVSEQCSRAACDVSTGAPASTSGSADAALAARCDGLQRGVLEGEYLGRLLPASSQVREARATGQSCQDSEMRSTGVGTADRSSGSQGFARLWKELAGSAGEGLAGSMHVPCTSDLPGGMDVASTPRPWTRRKPALRARRSPPPR